MINKILITLLFLLLNLMVYAQTATSDNLLTIAYTNSSLKEVMKDLTEKTKYRFSYSAKKIPEDTRITLALTQKPLYEVLEQLFNNLSINYEIVDDYIVLKKEHKTSTITDNTAKKHTLNGFIKDNTSSEFLIGATVFIKELNLAVIANNYGFFSATVPSGKYTIDISHIGYEHNKRVIDLKSNMKLDFSMNYIPIKLEETIIQAFRQEETIKKMHASQMKMTSAYIEQQPSLMGEPDVIKSLGYLPGITFSGDGSSYFHVRGGNYDQNLIILDEATIFNPSHLLGIFSPIIPDAVKSTDIYKADFPVNYGGRLSSVIDIHTKDGNKNNFNFTGSIGLISARGTIEGPIKKDASSFFVSFRRSYFDAYLKPSNPNLQDLYFVDFTTKLNLKISAKDRLFVTFYTGKDILKTSSENDDSNGINWTNQSFTLRWNHIFGSKVFLNTSLISSKYDYYLNTSIKNNIYWNSQITNVSLKEELTFFPSPKTTWRYGIKIAGYGFNPGNYFTPNNADNVQVSPVNSSEVNVYGGAEQEISSWLKFNYGLRLTYWSDQGKSFIIKYDGAFNPIDTDYYAKKEVYFKRAKLEPRLSLSIKTGKLSGLKASYNRTTQFLNLITNSISPFNSLEVWLPAGPNIKPQYADIADLGFVSAFGKFELQTDVYYKWLYNQIGYKYHANMLINPALEGELRQGKGWSYGFEIALKKETGKFQGNINYTYSRAFLQIAELNGGKTFPAMFDRPHNFNISLIWRPTYKWLISIEYKQSSGSRITTPTSFYYYRGYQVPVYTEQNNDKFPTYRRFDFATTLFLNKPSRKFQHNITFSVLNMAGRINPTALYFNKYKNEEGKFVIPMDRLKYEELTPTVRFTYFIIPSLTYQFRF